MKTETKKRNQKVRVISRDGFYVPQYWGRIRRYSNKSWIGFGNPNVRFIDSNQAIEFAKLVNKSVTYSKDSSSSLDVVWSGE